MKRLAALFCLGFSLALCGPLFSAGPLSHYAKENPFPFKIEGTETAEPGDLVSLDVIGEFYTSPTTGESSVAWILANSSKVFRVVEGNRGLVFASGTPGEYRFIACGAKEHQVAIAIFVVTIAKQNPDPEPDPEPDPDPVDPLPETKYGLLKWTVDATKGFSAEDKLQAGKMVSVYRLAALQIKSGLVTEFKEAQDACDLAVKNNMGAGATAWLDFAKNLRAKIESLNLPNIKELEVAWEEVIVGLGKVK